MPVTSIRCAHTSNTLCTVKGSMTLNLYVCTFVKGDFTHHWNAQTHLARLVSRSPVAMLKIEARLRRVGTQYICWFQILCIDSGRALTACVGRLEMNHRTNFTLLGRHEFVDYIFLICLVLSYLVIAVTGLCYATIKHWDSRLDCCQRWSLFDTLSAALRYGLGNAQLGALPTKSKWTHSLSKWTMRMQKIQAHLWLR